MAVTFSVAIMHVPTVPARLPSLAAIALAFPLATVVQERGQGVWDVASRAWAKANDYPLATHHVVLQDDATLCTGFALQVAAAIDKAPNALISFFTPSVKLHRFIPPGVALCMPKAWVSPFLTWAATQSARAKRHDNVLIGRWAKRNMRDLYYCAPSLVQHGAVPSTLGHRSMTSSTYQALPLSVDVTRNVP